MYKRPHYQQLKSRIEEPRKFIQVIMGPRQVGKTTVVSQVVKDLNTPYSFLSADDVPAAQTHWISEQWDTVRQTMQMKHQQEHLLIIDEIQKLSNWSETLKKEWDKDTREEKNIKVVILGSSRLLLQKGLTESLAGRFELIRMPHWSYTEMKEAFGWTLDQYIYFGGYPGSADLMVDEDRWKSYIKDSLIETSISKDVLMLTRVDKPALLRQLFELGSLYSGQILSFTKLLNQLSDAGNTTTLSNYLNLLSDCGLLTGIEKYAGDVIRKRGSSPKFQVYNNALMNAFNDLSFETIRQNGKEWGRLAESAIGSHLVNHAGQQTFNLYYWREGNNEVDYILERNGKLVAIEVKSGKHVNNAGLSLFRERYHPHSAFIVGTNGIPFEQFLQTNPQDLFL